MKTSEATEIRVSIVGCVGLPARYGGFETLAENLVLEHEKQARSETITVFCSSIDQIGKPEKFHNAFLRYIPIKANGISSVFYDLVSLVYSLAIRSDVILVLGVSGAMFFPFIRIFSNSRIITNIDGLEWKRDKWGRAAKVFLKFSEAMAIKYSDVVISDNRAIADYVESSYQKKSSVIAYGGDHVFNHEASNVEFSLPDEYAFCVCRIEPENNIRMILEAFSDTPEFNLIIVGNWLSSEFGRSLYNQFSNLENITLLKPIYDLGVLRTLRTNATLYVHGHSAGGTNPSLVEAMQFGVAILAYDCSYNRYTTDDKALYFGCSEDIKNNVVDLDSLSLDVIGSEMSRVANRLYTWRYIAQEYFNLMFERSKDKS